MSESAILEIEAVEKRFGGVKAVDGASFSVAPRSITALIGPNGAGKSSLFNVVTGFERAARGVVRFEGRSIFGYVIVILGGLGSYFGVLVASVVLMTLLEGTRYVDLPLASDKVAAVRFIIVGAVLIGLMAFRPQGLFGKRQEMLLRE